MVRKTFAESKELYQMNKALIDVKQPYVFGQVAAAAKERLTNLVKLRDDILKEAIRNADCAITACRRIVRENTNAICEFFFNHEVEITAESALDYTDQPSEVQKVINERSKNLFFGFRRILPGNFGLLDGGVARNMRVSVNNLGECNEIISTMKAISGYENERRVREAAGDFDTALELYAYIIELMELRVVDEKPFTKMGRARENINNEQAYVFCEQLSKLFSRSPDHLIRMENTLTAMLQGPSKDFYNGKLAMVKQYMAATVARLGRNAANEHFSQEVNVDRLFHFCWKVWQGNKIQKTNGVNAIPEIDRTSQVLTITAAEWTRIFLILDLKRGSFINQRDLRRFLANCANGILKRIRFEELENGTTHTHKFQNPMKVTTKRFANGAACVSKIMCVGQLLNVDQENKIRIVCRFYTVEMEIHLLHKPDQANISYFMTRVTFWFFHSILKGVTFGYEWSGLKAGNALYCLFEADQ